MNDYLKLLLVLMSMLTSSNAKTIEINMMKVTEESLKDLIIYESSILDYFWAGNDGVDCGSPIIDKLNIDYNNNVIKFTVIPGAQSYSCEERMMTCELSFQKNGNSLIHIMDEPVYLFDQCSL